jgi:MarR family 2-MHQ and catechol resistance regulon transcriptional repressor
MGTDTPDSRQRRALRAYVRLMRAANTLRSFAARQLAHTGLTLTQFAVLEALYHLGPMSLSEVARKVLTTGGNLTMVVGNLEKQGLVNRRCSAEDARVYILSLTAKGKSLISDIFPQHATALTERFQVLKPEEQELLGDLCRKLGQEVET